MWALLFLEGVMSRILRARMGLWLWVSLALVVLIGVTAPHLLPVSLYKLSLITSAAWVGYWVDRGLFPYARPDIYLVHPWSLAAPYVPPTPASAEVRPGYAVVFAAAMLRRAAIIAAAMIGVALGA